MVIFHSQFEGTPFYPENDRYWAVIEKYKVNQFYTAPTVLRSLMPFGTEPVIKYVLQALYIEIWFSFYIKNNFYFLIDIQAQHVFIAYTGKRWWANQSRSLALVL